MLKESQINNIIIRALKEDIGRADITTNALIPADKKIKAVILTQEKATVCGIEIARTVFRLLNKNIHVNPHCKDGDFIEANTVIMQLTGSARAILTGERVALNFLNHLSGIATKTREFVDKVKPFKARILDTRKTTPGLRPLEKYAVRCGGGFNHRAGLWDMVLIKDNHKKIKKSLPAGRQEKSKIKNLIEEARKKVSSKTKIEVEVENLKEFKDAILAKPDIIMLDNMSLAEIRKAVRLKTAGSSPKIEVSGNVSLNNVRKIAKTGVDVISIGSLTHSVQAVDMSLEIK